MVLSQPACGLSAAPGLAAGPAAVSSLLQSDAGGSVLAPGPERADSELLVESVRLACVCVAPPNAG